MSNHFKNRKNWKAFGIDYEYYLSLSDRPSPVCLSERQMYVLMVQNSSTGWLTRWYNTDDVNQLTVSFIQAEIEEILMACGCGVPAPTFTDYINSKTYVDGATTIYNSTYSTWNTGGQTVLSVAPNLDYATGTPADITNLMCLAWGLLLEVIIEQAKIVKRETPERQRQLTSQLAAVFAGLATAGGIATSLGGAAAAVVAFFGGPALILGLALASVGLALASVIQGVPDEAFVDEAAIEEIRCTLIGNATGMTPTRAVFTAALTPNNFIAGSNAAKIAPLIQPFLSDLNTYLQFIQQMSALYDIAPASALPSCATCVWSHTTDFALSDGGFAANAIGAYSAGNGWIDSLFITSNNAGYRGVELGKTLPTATYTKIRVEYAATFGVTFNSGDYLGLIRLGAADLYGATTPTRPTNPMEWNGSDAGTSFLIIVLASVTAAGGGDGGGSAIITKIYFEGTGANPFL